MINEDVKTLIKYRLEQAEEALDDAEFLFSKARNRAALNIEDTDREKAKASEHS